MRVTPDRVRVPLSTGDSPDGEHLVIDASPASVVKCPAVTRIAGDTRMRPWIVAAVLAALALSLSAQQPNSPTASAKWNDVNGPAWPIQTTDRKSVV